VRRQRRNWFWVVAIVVACLLGTSVFFVMVRRAMLAAQVTRARAAAAAAVAMAASARLALTPPSVPSRVTIVQRDKQPLPGTNGRITAHIGDITGGQTLLTVSDASGNALVNTVSMREGDSATFTVGTATIEVELVELKNVLTGDDFAVFALRQAGTALGEDEKIARLIDAVANEPGMTFVRNGAAHGGADAAAHLNRKYQAARDKGLTAREFVEHVASRSSMSGEPYRVRLPDGTEQSAEQWLGARLRALEGIAPATQPGK
jgi:hypothetical protein